MGHWEMAGAIWIGLIGQYYNIFLKLMDANGKFPLAINK